MKSIDLSIESMHAVNKPIDHLAERTLSSMAEILAEFAIETGDYQAVLPKVKSLLDGQTKSGMAFRKKVGWDTTQNELTAFTPIFWEFMSLQPSRRTFLSDLIGALKVIHPTKNVLEVGSGTGFLAELALSCTQIQKITGVDINSDWVEYSRARNLKNACFFEADICGWNPSERYDAAYSYMTFHHISRKSDALKTISGLLRPGAAFILFDKFSDTETIVSEGKEDLTIFHRPDDMVVLKPHSDAIPEWECSLEHILAELRLNGFLVESISLFDGKFARISCAVH